MGKCNTWALINHGFFFRWIIVLRSHNKLVKTIDFRFPFPFPPFFVFLWNLESNILIQGLKSKSQLQHWKFWKIVLKSSVSLIKVNDKNFLLQLMTRKLNKTKIFYLIHPFLYLNVPFPLFFSTLIPFLLLIHVVI